MKRRTFLKSLGALSIAPALPTTVLGATQSSLLFSNAHYQWAETIARSQNRFSTNQIQSLLGLPHAAAEALKSKLVENGVIHGYADATGFHRAAKPLYENLLTGYVEPANFVSRQVSKLKRPESISQDRETLAHEFNELETETESRSELEETPQLEQPALESPLEKPISE